MVTPQRALVKPRVYSRNSRNVVALEDVASWCLERHTTGALEVVGGPKSGKTTALRHLASLPWADELILLDDASAEEVKSAAAHRLVVYTTRQSLRLTSLEYELAGWLEDDLIEYLLATHPQRCSAVMARWVAPRDEALLAGAPLLYCLVADVLAADDSIPNVAEALRCGIAKRAGSKQTLNECGLWALALAVADMDAFVHTGQILARDPYGELWALLGSASVQNLMASSWCVEHLKGRAAIPLAIHAIPAELIVEVCRLGQQDASLLERVRERLADKASPDYALLASILHRLDPQWRPCAGSCLARAYLAGAKWNFVALKATNLEYADLASAELRGADLTAANCNWASFVGCDLTGALLPDILARDADFTGAQLSQAMLRRAHLNDAVFEDAMLDGSQAFAADFRGADLKGALLRGAHLRRCCFQQAELEGADFTGADLRRADLADLQLSETRLDDANLSGALLCRSGLEYMEVRGARMANALLSGALLTGSVMHGGDFRGASLRQAGLADIEWERADLRGADLRGCSFHLGSSRSGLVGSPYPGHGSRTGFYTNDYDEQSFKAPEEIRKANLRGADLRGACVAGVDFYLVDLRDALYDPEQHDHFRRCQAILLTK